MSFQKIQINRRTLMAAGMSGVSALALGGVSAVQAQTYPDLMKDIPVDDVVMGKADAPVTIIEYASMTCPHCKRFHEQVMPEIKKTYIDTGKANYILRPFPFDGDRRGEAAFMLALCAPNGNYYPMIDALFSTQQTWGGRGNPVPELLRLSKLAGMSEESFKECLGNQELLTKIIEGRNKAVKDFSVRATPTVFVNNEKLVDSSPETLKKAIEAAL